MIKINILILLVVSVALISCKTNTVKKTNSSVLVSWADGEIKSKIIDFVQRDTIDIPVKDRIAVFDMDGTIACESPLWFEMYCAVAKLNDALAQDSSLIQNKSYMYAKMLSENPADTAVLNNWVTNEANYIDSMVWKAFEGCDHEDYVDYCTKYLTTTKNKDKDLVLGNMFYKPMLELITYLQDNQYQVYIVSGSLQGVIWSVVPLKTTLKKRDMLIGSSQILKPDYSNNKTRFIIQNGIYAPKNVNAGKSDNIYARLGIQPVFAFGNTTDDFDMLQYAITNKHKGIGLLLNHNDPREYIYPPYHGKAEPKWKEKIDSFGGIVVDMKKTFINLWK
jgi:phosphoserine phosphatase